ncbi:hypothetical protein BJX61DRAFT_534374 [Aspergillus egyptiacus]|nr:hypothetical protein BJX61DRAFT_534374 [Aspergillus egyptiacus]
MAKKKNKKVNKIQESSEGPVPKPKPTSVEVIEEQPIEAPTLAGPIFDSTTAPSTEFITEHTAPEPTSEPSEPAPALEYSLEKAPEPELEQVQPAERAPTPFETEKSPFEGYAFNQTINPSTPSPEQPGDALVQEPSQEDLDAQEQFDTTGTNPQSRQSGSLEAPDRTPITAPQSPVFSFGPESATETANPEATWEENDRSKASAAQELLSQDRTEGPVTFNGPSAGPSPPKPVTELIELSSGLVSDSAPQPKTVALEVAAAAPLPESGPEPELESVPEPAPAAEPEPAVEPGGPGAVVESNSVAEPEPSMASEPVMEPERAIETVQEVTPPASKPSSPVLETASPSYKSASPMQRAMSPATISVADNLDAQHGISSLPPPAAPTPPARSPRSQHASPVKDTAYPVPRAAPPTPPNVSPPYHPPYASDQAYSPRQKPKSPIPKHASPVQKPSSSLPKVSSPMPHQYASPAMSAQTMPFPPMPPSVPPSTSSFPPMPPSIPPSVAHGYATAYQSPALSAAGYYPPFYGYYQPASHPHSIPRGSMPPNGAASFQAMADAIYGNGHDHSASGGPFAPHPDIEDPRELLERIQVAIPDINRLVGNYKQTKIKLQAREAEFKQMESQHKQALMHKDYFIEALQNQLRKTANEGAEEASKLKSSVNELRMELGNMEEKRKDLEEKIVEHETLVRKLEQEKAGLQEETKTLNEKMEEERVAHSQELEKQAAEREMEKAEALATLKQELTELFEEIKAEDEKAAAEALATREAELQEQLDAMKAEYEQQKQQMQESHNALQAEVDLKLEELASTKDDLEQRHKELEDTRQAHAEQIESIEKSHKEKVTEMEARLSEKDEELASSVRENRQLEEGLLTKEKQVEHSVDNMRLTIDNLGKDCDRLRKTLHSLGEATDLKNTKGDTFFLDCFGQLHRLIVDLSRDHFSYLPIDPPQEVVSKLPPELPSFLDNTRASRELRAAYVQDFVSKILTYRIFHPFLFTLGRRYDKADILFQMLSMDIRRKSVRREAFWRQQTLKAAYTTSDAKESINVVAAVIVDEISNHLKHFADPRHMDSLLTGIRRIVKLAAETWRHARVERELILASLDAPLPDEDWEEYGVAEEGSGEKIDPSRRVLLRPFPRIIREAAHEDFIGDGEKVDPCTYSRGVVLYADSPVVLARWRELVKKSEDALYGGETVTRRSSRTSNYLEPLSPLFGESTYATHDSLVDGATGGGFNALCL